MDRNSLENCKRCSREYASMISTWRSALESSGMVMKNTLGMNEKGLREYWVEQSKALPQHCSQPAQNHRGLVTLELPGPYVLNPQWAKGSGGWGRSMPPTCMVFCLSWFDHNKGGMNNPEYNWFFACFLLLFSVHFILFKFCYSPLSIHLSFSPSLFLYLRVPIILRVQDFPHFRQFVEYNWASLFSQRRPVVRAFTTV